MPDNVKAKIEWKKQLNVPAFKRNLQHELWRAMHDAGDLIVDRAKIQSKGAPAKRVGAGKWENIRRWYAAPPLTPPELVRIFTGRYVNSFWKFPQKHSTLCKVRLDIGNSMYYSRWVEWRIQKREGVGNVQAALKAVWTPIIYRTGLAVGRVLQMEHK